MKKFFNEFKQFIAKGNVLDLAVAVVIGNAFNKIVTSLVNDVIMPIIGIIIGGIHFETIKITFKDSSILIGSFIQNVVDFLIVAFTIFVVIKAFNKITSLRKKDSKEEEKKGDKKEEKKPDNIILLEEIRDLLKEKNNREKDNKKNVK